MSVPITVKAQLADIAARVPTVGVARAVCGWGTAKLSEAYAHLADVSSVAGVDDAARSLLDQRRAYVEKVYGQLETDDASQARDLTLTEKLRVAEVVRECSESVADVIDATGEAWITWDAFVTGVTDVAASAGAAAGRVLSLGGTSILVLIWAFVRSSWWVLLLVLVGVIVVRRKLAGAAAKVVLG